MLSPIQNASITVQGTRFTSRPRRNAKMVLNHSLPSEADQYGSVLMKRPNPAPLHTCNRCTKDPSKKYPPAPWGVNHVIKNFIIRS